MHVYPDNASSKLGLDLVLEEIASYAYTTLAQSALGSQKPSSMRDQVLHELTVVSELKDLVQFDDPLPFHSFEDITPSLKAIGPEESFIESTGLLLINEVLQVSRLLASYLHVRKAKYPKLAATYQALVPVEDVERRIEQVSERDGSIKDSASDDLQRIRRQIIRQQNNLRNALSRALKDAIGKGFATEGQPTMRSGRMVIPVRAEAKRKVDGFVHDVSATGQTVYIEPASCLVLNNDLRSLEADERQEVIRVLKEVAALIRPHRQIIRDNQHLLVAFDLHQAKARWARRHRAIVPTIPDKPIVDIREGRNPVLESHFNRENKGEGERAVVPLDLAIGEDFTTLVITGPNAGGKSVALKSLGLFAMLVGYGIPIPVKDTSRFGLFTRLFVDLGDEQSIEQDLSTFSSHIRNMREILEQADDRSLVLIDEAGTGTDPAEGGALAQAILEILTERGTRTAVTTHHGALKVFAHTTEGVENASMQFDRDTLAPTYRYQAGIPGSSFAFEIGQRMGLHPDALERARELVGDQKLQVEDLLSTLESRNIALEKELKEARIAGRKAEESYQKYNLLRKQLNDRKLEIQEAAIEKADEVVKQANAAVERTIREIKESQAGKEATRAARHALEAFKVDVADQYNKTRKKRKQQKETPAKSRKGAGKFGVGDQVVLDDGNTPCEVLRIEGKEAVILSGAMQLRVKRDRLTRVGGKKKQQVKIKQYGTGPQPALSSLKAQTSIDLRGSRVDDALIKVNRVLDEAIAANLNHVEVLHGKGTGALREAIRDMLRERTDVERFEEPNWDQGGAGVTLVYLK